MHTRPPLPQPPQDLGWGRHQGRRGPNPAFPFSAPGLPGAPGLPRVPFTAEQKSRAALSEEGKARHSDLPPPPPAGTHHVSLAPGLVTTPVPPSSPTRRKGGARSLFSPPPMLTGTVPSHHLPRRGPGHLRQVWASQCLPHKTTRRQKSQQEPASTICRETPPGNS